MDNMWSKSPCITPASIERYYAERAGEAKNALSDTPEGQEETTLESINHVNWDGNDHDAQGDGDKPSADGSDTSESPCTNEGRQLDNKALSGLPAMDVRNVAKHLSALDAATVHLTIAIRAASMKVSDALGFAIDALKQIDVAVVARAILDWIKSHPWETAAIVVPLGLLACTPVFLGLAGFTASGVLAGSIAAGIQAGIGSVAAGSGFAILTSAAMAGYGVPIVFGGVWGVSSGVLWGIAAWKNRDRGKNTARITDAENTGDED